MTGTIALHISRPVADDRWRKPRGTSELNQERFEGITEPIVITDPDRNWSVQCRHWSLPIESDSVDLVEIAGVIELVRDDLSLFREIGRILRSGGRLVIRVPSRGPLEGLDSMNLYRYLSDVVLRGPRIPDLIEVGFRRHLSLCDVSEALGGRFKVKRSWTRGLAVAEVARLGALILLLWIPGKPDRFLAVRPLIMCIERFDQRIPAGRAGYWLWIEAIKS